MNQSSAAPKLSDYRTVGQAAAYLGVSTTTLRNWDRSGKLRPRRHPQNGYRIYLHEDLESLLRSADADEPTLSTDSFAPRVDWSEMGETEHFVQFYESDEFLIESVSGFIGSALCDGANGIVIATADHRRMLEAKLGASGVDAAEAVSVGRFQMLDAAQTLATFMVDGFPDRVRFEDSVGDVVRRMADRGGRIHAFGEMVALLWAGGHRDAAIRLEELWNELGKAHRFSLFCAYPMAGFSDGSTAQALSGVCNCHSRVIPGESYHAADSPHERLQAIVLLQQKAQSLEAEIEHRKEVEKALQARERELADFFENGTEGLHKVGPDGTILWANKADCSLLGYSIEEYIGHSVAEFHADADVIDDMLQRLQRGESLENFPARLRCKNGTFKHVLVNSNACFEDGKFAYTRCFTRDISHQWQVENALREADRRKDEFLATLAHELRNPLAPVKNALAILELDSSNPTVVEEARSIMQRQVRHLVRLVDDLLDVSRITRDKITLKKDRVEVASIVESAVETSRPLIDVGRHQLTTTLPHQPLFVNGDATRLAQAVSNLLNNSAKYTPPGGRIQITVEASGTEVAIRVKDNGIGICCDDLVHVFDMFRQVDRSLERSQGGLGIGLTLVRRLVELHGGNVNAQSEGLGKGSEFVIRLPLAQVLPRAKPGPHDTSATPTTKRRILVVDDNRDSCDTLARLLRLSGHEIQTAHDGLEAIETASIFKPDVILMDVGMPNLNGYDATSRIRESDWGKEIDIFALTGWGQAEDVQKAMTAGCTGHMVKPVDFDTLNRLLVAATTPPKSGQSLIKNQRKPR